MIDACQPRVVYLERRKFIKRLCPYVPATISGALAQVGWPRVIRKEGSVPVSGAAKLSRAAKIAMVDKSETRMFKVRSPEESRAEESGRLEKAERDAKLKTEHNGHNVGLDGGGHTGGSSLFTHLFCCADPEDSGALPGRIFCSQTLLNFVSCKGSRGH